MKFIKSHYFKIVMLFIAIGSMAFLYWYGFYKKYEEKYLPQNADAIAILDVKNIRNRFFFSNIKNPSGWEWNTTRVSTKKKFDLSDFGIKTSDYVTFFHMENQPYTQWFVTMELEDESIFEKTVTENHFSRTKLQNGMSLYYSNALHLCLIRYLNQILVSNIEAKQKQIAIITAEDLFLKKLFLDTKRTEKMIGTTNAVTFWVKKNRLLEEDGILNLKLEEDEITIEGQLHFKSKFQKEWQFTQNSNALVSLGFDFEMIRNQKLITENTAKINKMIGFDLDSILAYSPNRTELVLNKMIEKKDSSISYGYDEDFNPIKKVVIHTNHEPSFHYSMQTANSKKLFDYLKNQNVIDNQDVFVNFPLARTKAFVNASSLKLEANPLKKAPESSAVKIGYLQIQFGRLYPNDWRFILAKNKNIEFLKSFETLKINLSKENNLVHFRTSLKTKEGKKLISVMK